MIIVLTIRVGVAGCVNTVVSWQTFGSDIAAAGRQTVEARITWYTVADGHLTYNHAPPTYTLKTHCQDKQK